MTPLLIAAASVSWTDTTWGKVLLAAVLVLLVNAVIFVPRRLIRMWKRRRQEVIPKVVGLVLSELEENFFQLQVSPPTNTYEDSGVRLAVAAQIPGESGRHVVTEPTPVPQNTLVIPKESDHQVLLAFPKTPRRFNARQDGHTQSDYRSLR